MLIISHRANLEGRNPKTENHPDQIFRAIEEGFDVETDAWFEDGKRYLGHDEPTYEVDDKFLELPKLWLHAKNKEAVGRLKFINTNWFWHQTDHLTLTSKGNIWCFPGHEIEGGIMVDNGGGIPEGIHIAGVCTDDPLSWKKLVEL